MEKRETQTLSYGEECEREIRSLYNTFVPLREADVLSFIETAQSIMEKHSHMENGKKVFNEGFPKKLFQRLFINPFVFARAS